jgi:hypothetical protein
MPAQPSGLEIKSVSVSRHLFSLEPAVRLQLSWNLPEGTKNFSFEEWKGLRDGKSVWKKFDHWRWVSQPDNQSATVLFLGLQTDRPYKFRLCSQDEGGAVNTPVELPAFDTPPPLVSFWVWFPVLVFLVAVSLAPRLLRLIGFHAGRNLDQRISDLEK